MDPSSQQPQPSTSAPVCYRHPDRQTRLACSSCGRPVCVDCVRAAAVGQKCPECAAPTGRHKVMTARDLSGRAGAPVTTGVLVVCIGIAALDLFAPALWSGLVERFAQHNALVRQGEWWRVLTAAFFHASAVGAIPTHLLFNMWALWVLGPSVERQVGSVPFALLYLGSAAAGGATLLLLRENAVAVGASGAIFGLFGAWLAGALRNRHTFVGRASLNQLLLLLGINLALPFLIPGIAWEAHVGGLVAGFVVTWAWGLPALHGRRGVAARGVVAGALLLVAMAVVVLA